MEELLNQILVELKEINNKIGKRTTNSLPDVVTVDDIMDFLQCGRTQAYQILNSPQFEQLSLGRKKGISKMQFIQWWEKQQRLKQMRLA